MSKKTIHREKKEAAPKTIKNSLLKATVVSKRGEEPLNAMASAMDVARRTVSLPRTLLSKGRSTQLSLMGTRYGETSSLTRQVSRGIDSAVPGSHWLPQPLRRIKLGVFSILVVIGVCVGMIAATRMVGPYDNSIQAVKAWYHNLFSHDAAQPEPGASLEKTITLNEIGNKPERYQINNLTNNKTLRKTEASEVKDAKSPSKEKVQKISQTASKSKKVTKAKAGSKKTKANKNLKKKSRSK